MALFNLGGKKKKRSSKKLKAPKKSASLKSKLAYLSKMEVRIRDNEKSKKVDAQIEKVKNYSFA